jgi:hypothetical protein
MVLPAISMSTAAQVRKEWPDRLHSSFRSIWLFFSIYNFNFQVFNIIVHLDILTLYPENTTATALKTLNYG